MKKVFVLLTIICVTMLGAITANAAGDLTLKIDADNQEENSTFTAPISVQESVYQSVYSSVYSELSAFEFTIGFSSDFLEYNGVLEQPNECISVKDVTVNPWFTQKKIIVTLLGAENTLKPGDRILDIQLKAKQSGRVGIFMSDGLIGTGQGQLIVPQLSTKEIVISKSIDVNKDGVVNLADAAIVSYNVGKSVISYPDYDLNDDAIIDRKDVELILSYLNR